MSKKYFEYEIIKTNEIERVYEYEDSFLYTRIFDFIGDLELPYLLRDGEVKILKAGVEDD
jgi:hypothetical protein